MLFVNSGATGIVTLSKQLKQQLRSAQVAGQWRGDTALTLPLFLAAVHGLSGLFRAVSAVDPFTLSSPSHSVPIPSRPSHLRGRKATSETKRHRLLIKLDPASK